MNVTLEKQIKKALALTLSDFKNPDESLQFLEDFFTKKELETFSKRLAIAYWLTKKRGYENIQNNLNVSSATIALSNKLLKKKSINLAIKKLDADVWAEKWSQKIKGFIKN